MREIYLDNSATTRVLTQAADEAYAVMTQFYGNPSSLHSKGIEAEKILTEARERVAKALGVDAEGIYFTSGGTEANNLAVLGTARKMKRSGNKVVVSAYEHDSVMQSAKQLSDEGFEVVYLSPDGEGIITPEAVSEAVDEKTVLVSIMLVNNEIGAINPVEKLSSAAKRKNPKVVFHCDAVQGFCKMPFRGDKLGADLITVTSHKIGGPKGVGALWIKKNTKLLPIHYGGEQEKRIRPGTEAMPLIAAFGKAASVSKADLPEFEHRISEIRQSFVSQISDIDGVVLNSKENALPAIVNVSVIGNRSEIMLHFLEERGIYVSSGSACAQGAKSHVLKAMGYSAERVDSALRISFGRENTEDDITELVKAIKDAKNELCR